jgi:hypothetical protein
VKHEDLGVELVSDLPRANGKSDGMGRVYVGHYEMEFGIAIEHPDSVWRIANIPTNPAWWDKAKRERFIDTVIETQDYLPPGAMTKGLYGNIRAKQILEKAGRETQVVVFSEKDPWGNPVSLVNGMRLRRVDVIKCGETV